MPPYIDEFGRSFSYAQEVTLAVTPKIMGFLSSMGSIWIIVEVATNKFKRQTVYNRLLLAMSIFDLMVATTYIASTWPIPVGSPGVIWAVGNVTTCSVQGFLNQFGVVPPIYNLNLSIYYLLVVRYGWNEKKLRYVEPIMHLVPLALGLGTSIASLYLKLFNNADLWCWISPLPLGCKQSGIGRDREGGNCVRGNNAFFYRWAFFYFPLWATAFLVLAVNVVVYLTVKKREREARALHDLHRLHHERPLPPLPGQSRSDPKSFDRQRNSVASFKMTGNIDNQFGDERAMLVGRHDPTTRSQTTNGDMIPTTTSILNKPSTTANPEPELRAGQKQKQMVLSDNDQKPQSGHGQKPSFLGFDGLKLASSIEVGRGKGHHRKRPSINIVIPSKLAELLRNTSNGSRDERSKDTNSAVGSKSDGQPEVTSKDIEHVMHHIEDYPSAAKQNAAAYQFGASLVLYQCMAYTFGFYTVWVWSSCNRIIQTVTGRSYFALLFLQCLFEPLQGLMNAVVYRFSSYLRLHQRYPHLSRLECFYYTWRWGFLGPPPDRGRSSKHKIQSSRMVSGNRVSSMLRPSSRYSYGDRSSRSSGRRQRSQTSTETGRPPGDHHVGSTGTRDEPYGEIGHGESNLLADLCSNSYMDSTEETLNNLMADLMRSYSDNPSLLNAPLSIVRTEFPTYDPYSIEDERRGGDKSTFTTTDEGVDDTEVVQPSAFPVLTTDSVNSVITEFPSSFKLSVMDDGGGSVPLSPPNENSTQRVVSAELDAEGARMGAIEEANRTFRVSTSGRSSTLVSMNSIGDYSSSSDAGRSEADIELVQ